MRRYVWAFVCVFYLSLFYWAPPPLVPRVAFPLIPMPTSARIVLAAISMFFLTTTSPSMIRDIYSSSSTRGSVFPAMRSVLSTPDMFVSGSGHTDVVDASIPPAAISRGSLRSNLPLSAFPFERFGFVNADKFRASIYPPCVLPG